MDQDPSQSGQGLWRPGSEPNFAVADQQNVTGGGYAAPEQHAAEFIVGEQNQAEYVGQDQNQAEFQAPDQAQSGAYAVPVAEANEQLITGSDGFRTESPETYQAAQLQAFPGFQFQDQQQVYQAVADEGYQNRTASPTQSLPQFQALSRDGASLIQAQNRDSSPSQSLQQFQALTPEGASLLQRAQVLQGFALQLQGLPVSSSEASSSQLLQQMAVVSSEALAATVTGSGGQQVVSIPPGIQMIPAASLPYMVNTVESLSEKPSTSSEASAVVVQHSHLVPQENNEVGSHAQLVGQSDETVSSLTLPLDDRRHNAPSTVSSMQALSLAVQSAREDQRSMEVDSTAEPDTTHDEDEFAPVPAVSAITSQSKPVMMVEMNGLHSTVDDNDIGADQPTSESDAEVREDDADPLSENEADNTVDELMRNLVNGANGNIPDMDQEVQCKADDPEIPSSSGLQAPLPEEEPLASGSQTPTLRNSYMLGKRSSEISQADQKRIKVRRSGRIASMDAEPRTVAKPVFKKTTKYNPNQLWCEDCQTSYDTGCPEHTVVEIGDKPLLSRAWASLPPMLQIFRFADQSGLGVFTKKTIARRTKFGPFIADLIERREDLPAQKFFLQLDLEGHPMYLDATDEHNCNWMMFVRPAQSYKEQNLVAFQHGGHIYFSATKNILPKQELKIWYAAHYAHHLGIPTHQMSEEDMQAESEHEFRWQCYDCSKKFRTSALLQKHLITHEEPSVADGISDSDQDFDQSEENKKRGRKAAPFKAGIRRKVRSKKGKEPDTSAVNYINWKKRTTSLYLNKYKRLKKKQFDGESQTKSIRSMYKRKQSGNAEEWMCTHCDLTFDSSSLLNLHTLTHAAEDVGLQEIQKIAACDDSSMKSQELSSADVITQNLPDEQGSVNNGMQLAFEQEPPFMHNQILHVVPQEVPQLKCPVCSKEFSEKRDLIEHAAEHGRAKSSSPRDAKRPYKCEDCGKGFMTAEKLEQHTLVHGSEEAKPLPCPVCNKRFLNNSALACHMKTHSDRKYFECLICHTGFDQAAELKCHMQTHAVNGVFTCPECGKTVSDVQMIKKHMRTFHSLRKYPCPHCDKILPRPDKLKLHLLKHSDHREFMCEACGRQFKRKDKLQEHKRRMHSAEREAKMGAGELLRDPNAPPSKKFVPKVSPYEYHRFIYKCHQCLIGFKRRGMLVNHLAKQHPDVKPETVPELNLPILKTQKDYYCQYCEKVYKSSSKRKAHIVKNHPGQELPISSRKKGEFEELPGMPNPTFSQTVGSVTTVPHPCEYCHKQYASKAKLLQHQRKKHPDEVPPLPERRRVIMEFDNPTITEQQRIMPVKHERLVHLPKQVALVQNKRPQVMVVPAVPTSQGDAGLPTADLLTQAMSELTQTLNEYRNQEFTFTSRGGAGNGPGQTITVHTIQPVSIPVTQTSTLELSHLGQALVQGQLQGQQIQIQTVSEPSPSSTPQETVVTSGSLLTNQVQGQQVTQVAYVPKSWANTSSNFPSFR